MSNASPLPLIGRRYRLIEQIGQGGMGVVYRADDLLTGLTVALKRVTTRAQDLIFGSHPSDTNDARLALAQEFQTLASLRHPNIISVLDYGFDDEHQPYFTMTLLEYHLQFLTAGAKQPLQTQIDLLVQMLEALAYLHRRGILHRDLKPGNVLVMQGQVKVLDFGLAVIHTDTTNMDMPVGTLAYMAPEVLLDARPSPASDLYAVGMMAYELLAGRHPFDVHHLTQLIEDIAHTEPDLSEIDPAFVPVLSRLLVKTPVDRYTNARDVIVDLCRAAEVEPPQESVAIRESFLQAARFVGRKTELTQLVGALKQASQGEGSTWLIGGESGVGKSRLLDELRAAALVQGVLVLRGQGISEGGLPYQMWRDALRWLALLVDLSDSEASALKALVPDLGMLLGRTVPDMPQLDSQASQDRLLSVIEGMFQKQQQPTLIILEDLQWATESLDVLVRLNTFVHGLPLLFIGSYRDDEKPDLPSALPDAHKLTLKRLTEQGIAELSESMLGNAGREEQIVDWLMRQTEGNVYFLVEVVRALAEEAGQLEDIGKVTLPANIFAGGIKRIVERRLERIPESHRPLLEAAAVAGRQLDLRVIEALSGSINVDQWLSDCASVAVLELQEGRWQFDHDKLRAASLATLTPERRQALHKQVALAIESAYPHTDEQASVLAYHWNAAGDTTKEAYYAAQAGTQSLRSGANQEAVRLLSRALVLDVQLHPESPSQETRIQRSHWERQIGEAYNGYGAFADGLVHLREALRWLGLPVVTTPSGITLSLLAQVLRQMAHRFLPMLFVGRRPDQREILLEGARIYELSAVMSYSLDQVLATLHEVLSGLNLAESAGPSPELAIGYSGLALVSGSASLHALARVYGPKGLATAQLVNDPYASARVLQNMALYNLGIGNWDEARPQFIGSAEGLNRLGFLRRADTSIGLLATLNLFIGNFAESIQGHIYTSQRSRRRGDSQLAILTLAESGSGLLRTGNADEAVETLENAVSQTIEALGSKTPGGDALNVYGPLALAYLWQGNRQRAMQFADQALAIALKSQGSVLYYFSGYSTLAQTYLELYESGSDVPPAERQKILQQAQQACAALHKFARLFPFAVPRDLLYGGLYEWFSGKHTHAITTWQSSLERAVKLAMPYEQGLAHYELGRHLDPSDPQRQEHLAAAGEIFERINAVYDLARVQTAQA
ncbi:MAG: AAA family ATPase [Chloroflexota bacterium]